MPFDERNAWSYSRSRLLHDCARAFHSQRAQAKKKAEESTIRLNAVAGVVVHDAIRSFIEERNRGRPVGLANLQDRAVMHHRRIWANPKLIAEVANGITVDPGLEDVQRNIIVSRLERFYRTIWPRFQRLRYETHEHAKHFRVDGVEVKLRIDFAGWDHDGRLVIVDWKTGGSENEEAGREQLAVYCLWAVMTLRLPIQRIVPAIASLRTGHVTEFEPVEADLLFARELIAADVNRVRAMEVENQFFASPAPEKCGGCHFLSTCSEGKATVSST